MTLNTILRFSRATTPEEMFTGQWQDRATRLDAYKPYLDQRWQEGCTNAWKLWEEIKEQGYPPRLRQRPRLRQQESSRQAPTGRPPPAIGPRRHALDPHAPDALPADDRLHLKAVLANCPDLTALSEHVRSFGHMVSDLQGDQLPTWIETATSTADLPSLRHFAQHLERDLDAVIAGLTLPWNSGVVEGHVNRIKMLKRQMFGRAGFELLRKRVLLYA
ncbi:transposase [Streptomyces aurantiacus]|uniref:Transposase IS204/IS1001/IS1096/IS1165 DDE domain-containing protein n=1 Tax=Streptomyces aurantiacus JA 4570 TaxID=1286094 RepID=S3ZC24_9ACTN|nr:transposase [Streptomyces aurantiacus]EPH40159.1 hypothetical protein STRAU_6772 [Streptomyces aurantiacus JA 4570]